MPTARLGLFILLLSFLDGVALGQTPNRVLFDPPTLPVVVKLNSPVGDVIAQIHDLSKAITAHVNSSMDDSDKSYEEARKEALQMLFAEWGDPIVNHEEVESGKFRVTATQAEHDQLGFLTEWMERGEKQVCIETRIITVSEESLKNIHRQFAKRWESSANARELNEQLALQEAFIKNERIAPSPQRNVIPISVATHEMNSRPSNRLVSAKVSSSRVLPCRIVNLQSGESATILRLGQASGSAMQAPKITLLDGQAGKIQDTTQRPFVVSVQPIVSGEAMAMQPVIEVLEEGLSIDLGATVVDEHLELDSQISFSRIGDVDTFTFEWEDGGGGPHPAGSTIQIPEHHVRNVQISSKVKSGMTVLVDPHFSTLKTEKRRFRNDIESREYTLILITPTVLEGV